MNRQSLVIPFAIACLHLPAASGAEKDLLAVQKRGIETLEEYRSQLRRTGSGNRASLDNAAKELQVNSSDLERQGRLREAARSILEAARCRRLLDPRNAAPEYQRARALAQRADDRELEAKAIYGLAFLKVSVERNFGEGGTLIRDGLSIAEALPDRGNWFDLLDMRGELEDALGDFPASVRTYDTLIRDLESRADRERLYSAYSSRSSTYFDYGTQCVRTAAAPACLDLLRRSEEDARSAMEAATRLAWPFAAKNIELLIATIAAQIKNTEVAIQNQNAAQRNDPRLAQESTRKQNEVVRDAQQLGGRVDELRSQTGSTRDENLERTEQDTFRRMMSEANKVDAAMRQLTNNLQSRPSAMDSVSFQSPRSPADVFLVPVATPPDQDLNVALYGMNEWVRKHPDDRVREIFTKAQAAIRAGNRAAALTAYVEMIDLLESQRSQIEDDRLRMLFMRDKAHFYDVLALNLLQDKRYEEAFSLLERNRARTLTEMLTSQKPEMRTARERKLLAEMLNLQAEVEKRQRANLTAGAAGRSGDAERTYYEYTRKLDEMKQAAPRLLELYRPEAGAFDRLQSMAREDEFDVLQYIVTDSRVVIWHSGPGPNPADAVAVLLSRQNLASKLKQLRDGLMERERSYDPTLAKELYLFLVSPVLQSIKTRHLVILAGGELAMFPFGLLQAPGSATPLGEQFQISLAPSVGVLSRLNRVVNLESAKVATVLNTSLGEAGAKKISALYPRHEVLKNPRKANLFQKLEGYDSVYFMTHGRFAIQDPMLASLELQPGGEQISAAEMFGLPLAGTRVVAVGACESGNIAGSSEMLGMVRALLFAGAQSLLLTSWDVSNDSAALYMDTFYREVRAQTPAEAARRALAEVRGRYPHPFHWAPFVYIGR